MNITLFGNSQVTPVYYYLKPLMGEKIASLNLLPACHVMKPEEARELYKQTRESDILILSHIAHGYRRDISVDTETLLNMASPRVKRIIILPDIHFEGQNPELFYFREKDGALVSEPFDYHNLVIFQAFLKMLDVDQAVDYFHNYDYIYDSSLADVSLHNLANREAKIAALKRNRKNLPILTLDLVPIISQLLPNHRLFYTFNHPTPHLLKPICGWIYKQIFDSEEPPPNLPLVNMNRTTFPLTKAIVETYRYQVYNLPIFQNKGTKYDLRGLVQEYFDFYNSRLDLIGHNLDLLRRSPRYLRIF